VAQLTRAMAEAWSRDGVNVNAIGPGFFRTELTAAVFADPSAPRATRANLHRPQWRARGYRRPAPVPLLGGFGYVTGQILMLDGGFTAK
jgi:NAD(P)-dependent dehydrogenase (short-subunit alcohol dehydrogenase family)